MEVIELTASPREREKDLRSGDAKEATAIRFVNRITREIKLYWLDSEVKRRAYGTVPASGQASRRSFSGHVWLVAGADDKPIAIYIAAAKRGRATIQEERIR